MQSVIGKTFERRAPQRAWNCERSQGRDQLLGLSQPLAQEEGAGDSISGRGGRRQTFSREIRRICNRGFELSGANERGDEMVSGCLSGELAQLNHEGVQ